MRSVLRLFLIATGFSAVIAPFLKVPTYSPYIHFTSAGFKTSRVFFVKASNDAFIGLFNNTNDQGLVYEADLGGALNTRSYLSEKPNVLRYSYEPYILDANSFRPFWIDWSGDFVRVGKGTVIGTNQLIAIKKQKPVIISHMALKTYREAVSYWLLESECKKL